MNSFLNYMIEANGALALFGLLYFQLTRGETDFRLKRFLLLGGIISSVIFPLIHITSSESPLPTLSNVIPMVWLPEFQFGGADTQTLATAGTYGKVWTVISAIYITGVCVLFVLFVIQLVRLLILIGNHRLEVHKGVRIAEGTTPHSSFSFFRFIYIGNATSLSPADKERIIAHELVHATQLHSFDILLINILGILFWFNPVLRIYHKTFVQLHEFEADARSVKNHEVNEYCNLLARVALMSADISMANYFNNSLTVKRIEMIRKIKFKLKRWKIAALCALVLGIFFVSACQDQVMNEVTDIAKSSTMATEVPENIQKRYDQLKSENPAKKYLLLEMNDHATAKISELEKSYGLPTSVEVFKLDGETSVAGKSEAGVKIERDKNSSNPPQKGFLILEYNKQTEAVAERSAMGDIYTVVEETPEFKGGMDALFKYIGGSMSYPKKAADEKAEGTVYVEFVVETNGKVTSPKIAKGFHPLLDEEALRVVKGSPDWIPGKQNGAAVRVKMVLPIKFKL